MLAPVERCTTMGVFGWQIKNNGVLSNGAELFSQQKRRETLLSLLLIFGQTKSERTAARVLILSHKIAAGVAH